MVHVRVPCRLLVTLGAVAGQDWATNDRTCQSEADEKTHLVTAILTRFVQVGALRGVESALSRLCGCVLWGQDEIEEGTDETKSGWKRQYLYGET